MHAGKDPGTFLTLARERALGLILSPWRLTFTASDARQLVPFPLAAADTVKTPRMLRFVLSVNVRARPVVAENSGRKNKVFTPTRVRNLGTLHRCCAWCASSPQKQPGSGGLESLGSMITSAAALAGENGAEHSQKRGLTLEILRLE